MTCTLWNNIKRLSLNFRFQKVFLPCLEHFYIFIFCFEFLYIGMKSERGNDITSTQFLYKTQTDIENFIN